jgi:hypothetical protein
MSASAAPDTWWAMSDPSKFADEPLTGVLAEIADVLDRETALKIAAARGGTRVYLSPRPGRGWLVDCIGLEQAQKLCKELVGNIGMYVTLPVGPQGQYHQTIRSRERQVVELLETGLSPRKVALKLNISARNVWRIKATARKRLQRSKGSSQFTVGDE